MSLTTPTLTSTLAELYHTLKDIGDNNPTDIPDVVEVGVETSPVGQSIEGKYRYEVLDSNGLVYDSGDWKPNLILNCGLDKLAEMPIAQVFQFAVAGKDPTPTKDSYESTNLSVELFRSSDCKLVTQGNLCSDIFSDDTVVAKPCTGSIRIAPDHAIAANTCEDKAFGETSDNGKLLYLRDMDLQYNIVSSCPVYTSPPSLPDIQFVADCSMTLSAAQIPGGLPTTGIIPDTGMTVNDPGNGYMASLSHDTGGPWNAGGLIVKRKNFDLPAGRCTGDLLSTYQVSSYHTVNNDEWAIIKGASFVREGVGIECEPPNIELPDITATINSNSGVFDEHVTINNPGGGMPRSDRSPNSCDPITVTFPLPSPRNPACKLGALEANYYHYAGAEFPIYYNGGSVDPATLPGDRRYYSPTQSVAVRRSRHGATPNTHRKQNVKLSEYTKTGEGSRIANWASGNINAENIVRIGSRQLSKYTYPELYQSQKDMFGIESCNSFEEFFAKIILYYWFRPLGIDVFPSGQETPTRQFRALEPHLGGPDWSSVTTPQIQPPVMSTPTWIYSSVVPFAPNPTNWDSNDSNGAAPNSYVRMSGPYPRPIYSGTEGNLYTTKAGHDTNHTDGVTVKNYFRYGYDNVGIEAEGMSFPYIYYMHRIPGYEIPRLWHDAGPGRSEHKWSSSLYSDIQYPQYKVSLASTSPVPAGFYHDTFLEDSQQAWVNQMGSFSSGNHIGDPEPGFEPHNWLPWFMKNNATTVDTAAGDGKAYVDKFGGKFGGNWADFKATVLEEPGVDVYDPTDPFLWDNDADKRGNLFSGIPIGAFSSLNTYRYNFTGNELDLGVGIKSVDAFPALGEMLCVIGDNTSPRFNGNVPKGLNKEALTRPHYIRADEEEWVKFTTKNGEIESVTFDFDALYRSISLSTHNHVNNALCDRSLLIGLDAIFPKITRQTDRPAKGVLDVDSSTGEVISVEMVDNGVGYCPTGETVRGIYNMPTPRTAVLSAATSPVDGSISSITVIDPGAGYSPIRPVNVCFPEPPKPDPVTFGLILEPVKTYETVNNGDPNENGTLPLPTGSCLRADIYNTNQTKLFDQYKTHGWYLTGTDVETNTTYCGTDFLTDANQIAMTRTFDFYMELQPVTYSEIGFKESPAACELWSRIALDPPVKLCPGQHLRIAYQLVVTLEPGPTPKWKKIPSDKNLYNQHNPNTGEYWLEGYECIQGLGLAVVDHYGVAAPYDITGLANEPYAPGTTNLGPQYGFVNRWKNGDTRLSWPTKEYTTDLENPWLLGGDQTSPPDWAKKFEHSPTINYLPRSFSSYLEWPAQTVNIPDINVVTTTLSGIDYEHPAGPEMTFERDAFDHWFTKAPPMVDESVTWTQFVHNGLSGEGRWDFLITKEYTADIMPHQMDNADSVVQNVRDADWVAKYKDGQPLPDGGPLARSAPGVFPGPVIEYDGPPGALHDPISVKTNKLNRNGATFEWPYCDRYVMKQNMPNNNTFCFPEIEYEARVCKAHADQELDLLYYYSTAFCWNEFEPIREHVVKGGWGLTMRQMYLMYGNIAPPLSGKNTNQYPVVDSYGGGFCTLESWKPWTHTPLITSANDWQVTGADRDRFKPDTAGNWSKAEAIPVAGASGFISTSDEDFAPYGKWVNRSQTVQGAAFSPTRRPINDYSGDQPLSFEVPTYLEPYNFSTPTKAGDHCVKKHAVFEASMANLTGVKCIGLGPTSTTLIPKNMTDAARFNTYVFKIGDLQTNPAFDGVNKLMAYKLDVTFQHTFYRNLKS